jgi:hypothetical protein
VNTARAVAILVVLAALAATGCSGGSSRPPAGPAAGAASSPAAGAASGPADDWADPAPARAGGRSTPACDLPVAFDVATGWVAKPVAADAAAAWGGPHRVVCEIDGKPAGVIGFIRVYAATGGDVRNALQEHLRAPSRADEQRFRPIGTPAGLASEVAYRGAESPVRVFAVTVGSHSVLVDWAGLDEEEHRGGLPAYVLARGSIGPRS